MPRLKKKISVKANGKSRLLFSLEENSKGDVYLRVHSGTQVGIPPNAIRVTQDRFSLHPSHSSDTYITVKHTLELENGFKQTSSALTDSVKLKNGFSHVLTHRFSDLLADVYDIRKDNVPTIELGDFDPGMYALVVGVFVGHPDSPFLHEPGQELVTSIQSENFQIVFLHTWVTIPAAPFAWTLKTLTFAPELHEDEGSQISARQKMRGESSNACAELFRHFVNELVANLLETYMDLSTDDEIKAFLQEQINAVPRVASIRI